MKPGQYRKEFGIPSSQSLAAKSYVESRRRMAIEKGLGEGLAKARATRKAETAKRSASLPVVKVKAPVPAVKRKAAVPAKIDNALVSAKVTKASGVKPTTKSRK
jgi:hypothetical protein